MPRSFIIASLLVGVLGLGQAGAASTYKIVGVVAGDTLNLRQQPGVNSKVLYKLPANTSGISLTGRTVQVGKTRWAEIKYQGKVGWVNQRYVAAADMKATGKTASVSLTKADAKTVAKETKETKLVARAPMPKPAGSWILACGNTSPFWKTEILPKSINLYQGGDYAVNVPITYKNQEHGANKLASVTVVKGARGQDNVKLTIKYSGQCRSSLFKRRVSFKVTGSMNDEKLSGCCYSYPVK